VEEGSKVKTKDQRVKREKGKEGEGEQRATHRGTVRKEKERRNNK
jgi:hypothetical protein